MYPIVSRFTPVGFYFLSVICVAVPFVATLEAETSWGLGKDVDALSSLFSNLEVEKLQSLLKNVPPAELQKVASRVLSEVNTDHSEQEKRSSILKAIKKEGLLDSWKEELDNLIFDDNALPLGSDDKAKEFQRNLKCQNKDSKCASQDPVLPDDASSKQIEDAVEEMLFSSESNGTPPINQEQIDRNDIEYLLQTAEETLDTPSMKLEPPKLAPPPYKSVKKPTSQEKKKPEPTKKAYKKKQEEPLDALVGMAKKLLGQDESDPTLDIVANMASAYMKNMDNSGKKKSGNNSPDLASMLQMASLFAGGAGNAGDNPLQSLASLLGNSGMDMGQLLQMGSALMGQGFQDSQVARKTKTTSPIAELIIRFLANFLNMDSVVLMDYYNGLSRLSEANSWNDINIILRKTTGTDVESMLDLLGNEEVREKISDTTTSNVVHWLKDFLEPDSLQTKIMYLNAFLMQYNYPLLDPKNVVESFNQLIERVSQDYLNTKINLRPYFKQTEKQLKRLLHIEATEQIDFRTVSERELAIIVQHTMKNEVFDPLAVSWMDFRLASRFPKCARTILCQRNVPSNSARSPEGLKQGVTRATSTIVVWALSKTNNRGMPSFDVLYKAAFDGTTDCEEKYRENCEQILKNPLPSMRLDYEHHEL